MKFPTEAESRVMFDEKMKQISEITGRNIELQLEMIAGPDTAKILYNQMAACYFAGISKGFDLADE